MLLLIGHLHPPYPGPFPPNCRHLRTKVPALVDHVMPAVMPTGDIGCAVVQVPWAGMSLAPRHCRCQCIARVCGHGAACIVLGVDPAPTGSSPPLPSPEGNQRLPAPPAARRASAARCFATSPVVVRGLVLHVVKPRGRPWKRPPAKPGVVGLTLSPASRRAGGPISTSCCSSTSIGASLEAPGASCEALEALPRVGIGSTDLVPPGGRMSSGACVLAAFGVSMRRDFGPPSSRRFVSTAASPGALPSSNPPSFHLDLVRLSSAGDFRTASAVSKSSVRLGGHKSRTSDLRHWIPSLAGQGSLVICTHSNSSGGGRVQVCNFDVVPSAPPQEVPPRQSQPTEVCGACPSPGMPPCLTSVNPLQELGHTHFEGLLHVPTLAPHLVQSGGAMKPKPARTVQVAA